MLFETKKYIQEFFSYGVKVLVKENRNELLLLFDDRYWGTDKYLAFVLKYVDVRNEWLVYEGYYRIVGGDKKISMDKYLFTYSDMDDLLWELSNYRCFLHDTSELV